MNMSSIPHLPVFVVGGGQAGLSVSQHLCAAGIEHLVFERAGKFESRRRNRWDSFCLVTPNWQCRLPDWPCRGADPDGFMLKDEIVEHLDGFASSFDPPLREHVDVTRISRPGKRCPVETGTGPFTADQIVIATGGYDSPIVPPFAAALDPSIVQIHARAYRNPAQMPSGGTLTLGTGQSGVQVMDDFHLEGRQVHLAVGPGIDPGPPPRHGRDGVSRSVRAMADAPRR